MQKTDVLIIGSGIAGLSLAMKIAQKRPDLVVTVMTKGKADNTNTKLAQGGIAVVTDLLNDSFERHIQDTLASGGGICDEKIVEMVVRQAPERLKELLEIGASFDKGHSGSWDLGLEGGHSRNRILHHKDTSGWEIENRLLETIRQLDNVVLLENHLVIDLNTENEGDGSYCSGAFYFDKNNNCIKYIRAKTIALSTGGCGQVFQNTTNPDIATGDGIAIASRAGAIIEDMQYIQFHPTALYETEKNPYFLISEAVRGFGAHIVNEDEKRFVFKYDIRGELATRDIVSQAIGKELEISGKKHVYLDCRHLDFTAFYKHFPAITEHCINIGIHPEKELIPIVPVAHYQCGGIKVDENGGTNIQNLYTIGECSRTGLHGKNRLASNSLLEALVFAHQASKNILNTIDRISFSAKFFIPKGTENIGNIHPEFILSAKAELKRIMTSFFTHSDNADGKAFERVEKLKKQTSIFIERQSITTALIELTNMLTVASIILEHSNNSILSEI